MIAVVVGGRAARLLGCPNRDLAVFEARSTTYERGRLGRLHRPPKWGDTAFSRPTVKT